MKTRRASPDGSRTSPHGTPQLGKIHIFEIKHFTSPLRYELSIQLRIIRFSLNQVKSCQQVVLYGLIVQIDLCILLYIHIYLAEPGEARGCSTNTSVIN